MKTPTKEQLLANVKAVLAGKPFTAGVFFLAGVIFCLIVTL